MHPVEPIRVILSAALITALGVASFVRSAVYEDEIVLYTDIVAKSPNKARPHNNLGENLKKAGRIAEAQQHLERALMIQPNYPDAMNNLATIFGSTGRKGDAVALLQQCLILAPGHAQARFNLAIQFYERGMVAEAVREYELLIATAPQTKEAAFAVKMLQMIRSR